MALVKELEHLKISLDVIKSATNNFGVENFIGVGGFGKVYKGEISENGRLTKTVAIKRLDRRHGQGDHEFLTEIMMLSRYRHKNLVSLIGFCDEDDEKILVYEYEFNGSLEKYLSSEDLTWSQRLKICIGAARGLEYLHNPLGTQQRVLHRDVKSANFLLDHNWEAKISDFGLSRIGPANQEFTFLVSTVVGTLGYCDPLYAETGILTKESDVYSFGVVLFEVLCGRFCIGKHDDEHRLLIPLAQRSYEKGTLDDIIFRGLREQMEPYSLKTFSSVAYQCLKRNREERPTMVDVLSALELASEYQESYESGKPMEYEEILQMADREHPLVYTNKRELISLLTSGILVDWGRRWFSLSKNEHNCELISASEFSFQDPDVIEWIPHPRSRFSEVAKIESARELNIEVDIETIFLSPGIAYAAYLVFMIDGLELQKSEVDETGVSGNLQLMGLTYKLKEVCEGSITYIADNANDGWMIIELCQFICYKKVTKLEVFLGSTFEYRGIVLEGIQFLPIEKFFYLDKDGIKCCMLSASSVLKASEILSTFHWISTSESRFGKVAECLSGNSFRINCHINSHMLSSNTAYAVYLVYTLPENSRGIYTCPLQVQDSDKYNSTTFFCACLIAQETHVINKIKDDGDHSQIPELWPLYRPKLDSIPKERKDGWMEVQIMEYKSDEVVSIERARFVLSLCVPQLELTGLIVVGIEIRPL
ncbi:serine/threonine/dual specificity protein kinase, catalytic domain-containing protein [Artemisia annua]|uniref:Serine/threonine/dual specificity protein kinase, catalytic domain-containing protein n=1 Tax=Artemisia annua TaxID=35608 RepID=A0A2U1PEV3_ARTAN|nr:serine/threonine/dual specificity protein kinase, catalytic domain-containing protein [Artemisia annua]